MTASEEEIRKKLKYFVTQFVLIYEKCLTDYLSRIFQDNQKEGRSVKVLKNALKFLQNTPIELPGNIVTAAASHYSVRYNKHNAIKIFVSHLDLFEEKPDEVREKLVEAAYRIFCSFEWQFIQATVDKIWKIAMFKLAEDAVGRAFNYYKENTDSEFSADSVIRGVILGNSTSFKSNSHSGHTVQNEKMRDWNTGDLFSKVGITDGTKYYGKIDGTSNTSEYGYRLTHQFDKFSEYQEHPLQPIYTYVLKKDDVSKQVQELLSYINSKDYSLEKVEERIKNIIIEKTESIEEFLEHLKSLIESYFKQHKKVIWHEVQSKLTLFSGRHKQLEDIDARLKLKIIPVICGLGGIGKTELALQYVHIYYNKQFSVINIDASTEKTAREEFSKVHRKLELKMKSEDGEQKSIKFIVEEVYEYLGENSLFIFDNAENYQTLEKFLPITVACKPFIIITSNNRQEWTSRRLNIETLPLVGFEEEEAIKFVKDSLEDDAEDKTTKLLVETLHSFPLALSQAVAYIKNENIRLEGHTSKYTLIDYLRDYNENPRTFLEYEMDASAKSIFKTLDIAIARIKEDNLNGQQALDLLNYVSYFMSNDIPQIIFLNELSKGNDKKFVDITNLLKKYDILHLKDSKLNVHGLVQKAVRLKLEEQEEEKKYLKKILDLLKEKLNKREDVEMYSNHIITIWKYAHVHKDLIDTFIMDNNKNAYTTYFHLITEGDSYITVKAVLEQIKTSYPDQLDNLIAKQINEQGNSLLNAASSGNVEIVKLLINYGAQVTVKKRHGWRPLHLACKNGHLNVVQVLLKKGASVDQKTGFKYTPLHLAAGNGWSEIITVLLENKADINAKTRYDETPLHIAVKANEFKSVAALLENVNVVVNAETKFKWTPLHFAAGGGKLNIVKALLSKQANINAQTNDHFSPLHYASLCNYLEIVQEFLAFENIKINTQTNKGNTPLHLASEKGHVKIVRALLNQHADLNVKNLDKLTPLHCASLYNNLEVVEELLTFENIDINAQTTKGNTALHLAAEQGNVEVVKVLLMKRDKIDTCIINTDNKTAKDLAANESIKNLFPNNL